MREMTPRIAPDEVRRPRKPAAEPPAKPAAEPRKGPGPSKLTYRIERAWAKPLLRNLVTVYLPLLALGLAGWSIAADDRLRGAAEAKVAGWIEAVAARPEFAVKGVEVTGGTDALNAEVRQVAGVAPGTSSLMLDVEDIRARVEALGAVERASVQFDPQGALRIAVVRRIEVALHRHADGRLVLIDKGGVEIGPAGARLDHPELPLLLGEGADRNVPEALALIASAADIVPRLRALVRVGARRWDLVLDRDMVIQLPPREPVRALSRVMALHYGEELLDRDLAVIDMRLPDRPALRMTPAGAETFQIRRAVSVIGGEKT
ncbi:MAG TPA: cell division protein FtsQ/DivIB [Thermohalobaculum sp.]|nr:cell division protein FtsQ/DivIB [Thermohalobaculum sp.]